FFFLSRPASCGFCLQGATFRVAANYQLGRGGHSPLSDAIARLRARLSDVCWSRWRPRAAPSGKSPVILGPAAGWQGYDAHPHRVAEVLADEGLRGSDPVPEK